MMVRFYFLLLLTGLLPFAALANSDDGFTNRKVFATPAGSSLPELSRYKGQEMFVLFDGPNSCLVPAEKFYANSSITQLGRFLSSVKCGELGYRILFRNKSGQIDSVYQFDSKYRLTDKAITRGEGVLEIMMIDVQGMVSNRFDFLYENKYREAGKEIPTLDQLFSQYTVYDYSDIGRYSFGSVWILSIGIDDYGSNKYRNCKSDAISYVDHFRNSFFQKFRAAREDQFHSYVLLDSAATRQNILNVLQEISRNANFNDYFIFNFSGQSYIYTSDSVTFTTYFHPYEIVGRPEKAAKRDPSTSGELSSQMLSLHTLQEYIQQIPSENQLFISEAGPSEKFKPEFISALMRNSIEVSTLLNKNRVVIVPNGFGWDFIKCGDSSIQKGPLNYFITSLGRKSNIYDLFSGKKQAQRIVYDMKRREYSCNTFGEEYFEVFFEREFLQDYKQLLGSDPGPTRGLKGRSSQLQKEITELSGQRYALLIGTSKYQAPEWKNLANPVKDVIAVGEMLKSLYGFEVEVLENVPMDSIFSAISAYYRKVQPNDQVLIYFAGHGDVDDQLLSDGFIVCTDSRSPEKDIARNSYISYLKLQKMINNLAARQVLVMLDVCHGGVFDQKAFEKRDNPSTAHIANRNVLELLKDKLPLRTRKFLSSVGVQSAFDGEAGKHSPFVNQLLQILASQAKDPNGVVLLSDIYGVLLKSSLNETATLRIAPHMADFGNVDAFTEFIFIPLVNSN